MSRLPTSNDGQVAFDLMPIQAQPAPAPISYGIAGLLQPIAEKAEEVGMRVLDMQRKRKLIDYETEAMTTVAAAVDAAERAPEGQEQATYQSVIGPFNEKIRLERDIVVRDRARGVLEESAAVGSIKVNRNIREAERVKSRIALDQHAEKLIIGIQAGTITEDQAIESFGPKVRAFAGSALTQSEADIQEEAFRKAARSATGDFNRAGLLKYGDALTDLYAAASSDEERAVIRKDFDSAIKVRLGDGSLDPLQAAQMALRFDEQARIKVDREIGSIVARGNDAAAIGDLDELDELETRLLELPKSHEREAAESQFRRLGAGAWTVGRALATGHRLAPTEENQKQVDRMAAAQIDMLIQTGAKPDDAIRAVIDRFGPIGILPTQIVDPATTASTEPEAVTPQLLREAVDAMTYSQTRFPRAYEQAFDPDVRAWHKWMRALELPGSDIAKLSLMAQEAFNPTNQARAAEIRANAGAITTFALSRFVELAEEDDLLNVDLGADLDVSDLFSMEGEIPRFRRDVFSSAIDAEIPARYVDRVTVNMIRGMSKEAAVFDAWESLIQAGMGATRVFRPDNPAVRLQTPERMYGYPSEEIEFDIAHVILEDQSFGRMLWPDAMERPKVGFIGADSVIEFGRKHFDLIPAEGRSESFVFVTPDGKRLPTYWLQYVDEEGRHHPVFRQEGENAAGPYLLAPYQPLGATSRIRLEEQRSDFLKAAQEQRRPRPPAPAGGGPGTEGPEVPRRRRSDERRGAPQP